MTSERAAGAASAPTERAAIWPALSVILAVAGLGFELWAGAADVGNLLLHGFVIAVCLYPGRSAWMVPFLAFMGVVTELRESTGPDAAPLALFTALLTTGSAEAWLRRGTVATEGDPEGLAARARAGTLLPDLLAAAGMLVVGLAPLALTVWAGVPALTIVAGALSWAVGVGLVKVPAFRLLIARRLAAGARPAAAAAANGALSACGELGCAAAFLYVLPELGPLQALGFGLGPAAAEAILLAVLAASGKSPLRGTVLQAGAEELDAAVARMPRPSRVLLPVLERALTVPLHAGTRVLIWASLQGYPLAALVGFLLFAATDGWATFALLGRGRPARRLASVYAVAGVSALLAALGAWLVVAPAIR